MMPVTIASSAPSSSQPRALRSLAAARKRLEARRVAQLWSIAKTLDEVARRELKALDTARRSGDDDASEPANHDPIDVSFVD